MNSMSLSFFGQLSSVLWLAFIAIALVRIVIKIKDSRRFTSKH